MEPNDDQQTAPPPRPPQWQEGFKPRMCQHVTFARDYARRFAHGAPGHLDLMTIAKLADLLDELECNGALQRIGGRSAPTPPHGSGLAQRLRPCRHARAALAGAAGDDGGVVMRRLLYTVLLALLCAVVGTLGPLVLLFGPGLLDQPVVFRAGVGCALLAWPLVLVGLWQPLRRNDGHV